MFINELKIQFGYSDHPQGEENSCWILWVLWTIKRRNFNPRGGSLSLYKRAGIAEQCRLNCSAKEHPARGFKVLLADPGCDLLDIDLLTVACALVVECRYGSVVGGCR